MSGDAINEGRALNGGSALPAGFESLEPFVAGWAIAGSGQRMARRNASDEAERVAFHAAAKDELPAALVYLDSKPLARHDEKDRRLMDLMLSLAHVTIAVETQRDQEPVLAVSRRRVRIPGTVADLPLAS